MDEWYVCVIGGDAVGPVSTELLLLGISSGKVPEDAFVCRVGKETWSRIVEVPELARALPGPKAFSADDEASRYVLRSKLGEGGMGEVHLSTDAWIARDVALKVMRPEQSRHDTARARFVREARIQGQLEHPSIVPVYDIGMRADGAAFFTMKRVKGHTLHAILHGLRTGHAPTLAAYSRRRLLAAMSQVSAAVAFAHSRGIVHRDLKPDNVMLGDFGEVYVLDWGVAKVLEDSWARVPQGSSPAAAPPGQTQSGSLIGTPGYAAPEQVKGDLSAVGPRSDVYSLGAILYEVLALAPLHEGSTVEALVTSTLLPKVARPSDRRAGIAPELDAICVRAAAWDPASRFPTARELHEALERALDGERDAERRRELAREHVTAAERAFSAASAGGGEAEAARVLGMRELGAALALEPTNEDASRTLVRVLLQEPARLPPEAEAELREVDIRDRVRGAKVGMLFYAATCLPVPFLTSLHVRRPLLGLGLLAVVGATTAYLAWMWQSGKAEPRYMRNAVILSFFLCAIQTSFFGPFVVAPGAAAATAAIFLVNIRASASSRRAILAMALASVFVPAGLQALGVLPSPYAIQGGRLVIAPDLFDFDEPISLAILAFSAALTIAATVVGVGRAVQTLVTAERANFAQAWRLRQILDPGPR